MRIGFETVVAFALLAFVIVLGGLGNHFIDLV